MCGNLGAQNLALCNGKKAKFSFDNEILVFYPQQKILCCLYRLARDIGRYCLRGNDIFQTDQKVKPPVL